MKFSLTLSILFYVFLHLNVRFFSAHPELRDLLLSRTQLRTLPQWNSEDSVDSPWTKILQNTTKYLTWSVLCRAATWARRPHRSPPHPQTTKISKRSNGSSPSAFVLVTGPLPIKLFPSLPFPSLNHHPNPTFGSAQLSSHILLICCCSTYISKRASPL